MQSSICFFFSFSSHPSWTLIKSQTFGATEMAACEFKNARRKRSVSMSLEKKAQALSIKGGREQRWKEREKFTRRSALGKNQRKEKKKKKTHTQKGNKKVDLQHLLQSFSLFQFLPQSTHVLVLARVLNFSFDEGITLDQDLPKTWPGLPRWPRQVAHVERVRPVGSRQMFRRVLGDSKLLY